MLPYLLIGPGVMALMVGLAFVLPWLSPKPFSIERFRPTYDYVMTLIVMLFAYIQIAILVATVDEGKFGMKMIIGGIFLFFAALGNVLGKVRRNFWMGVRTPWTLSSKASWTKTHRLAGWLFILMGLLAIAWALAQTAWLFDLMLAVDGGCLVLIVVYSYLVYRRDQLRTTPAGTSPGAE